MDEDELYDKWKVVTYKLSTAAEIETDCMRRLQEVMRMYDEDPSSVTKELYPTYCS